MFTSRSGRSLVVAVFRLYTSRANQLLTEGVGSKFSSDGP